MVYQIKIKNTDIVFPCQQDQKILEAAHENNVLLSYGCKSGLCGSCEIKIESGELHYPEGKPRGLTDEEIESGKALICKAIANSDLEIRARVDNLTEKQVVTTIPVKVAKINYLAKDVVQLFLQLPTTENPFQFYAGQWFYFVLKNGKKRAFSIANAPSKSNQLEVHIRHANGGVFTDFVFEQLRVSDILKIEGPHGTFYYHQDSRPLLMVAGGTGFAPIKGIIEGLSDSEKNREIYLYWGVRTQQDLYMIQEVKQWQDQDRLKFFPVLSHESKDSGWSGETGFVHESIVKHFESLKSHSIYMAGPPQMIKAAKTAFLEKGAKEKYMFYDAFEYSEDAAKAIEDQNSH